MQVTKYLVLGCLSLGALSVGCGGGDSHHMGSGSDHDDINYTCSASVAPGLIGYSVDGDVLTLSDPEGVEDDATLTRESGGADLTGSWLANVSDDGVLEARLYFVVGSDTITVRNECRGLDGAHGVAEATTPANITDTTIELLEDDEDTVEF